MERERRFSQTLQKMMHSRPCVTAWQRAGGGRRRAAVGVQRPDTLPTTRWDTCSGLIRDNQEDADLFAWLQLMHQHCEQVLFALHGLYLQARCIITHGYEWYCAEQFPDQLPGTPQQLLAMYVFQKNHKYVQTLHLCLLV